MTGTAVAAVLLCAAYVRLSHPDLAWFSVDQARDARVALDIVAGRSFPVVGPEVAGGPAHTWGPAYFYLLSIPFAISRDPALAVAWLSAMTLASIPLTYRFAARFFGRPVALLSIAFVSTYPLAVIESKVLWNMAAAASSGQFRLRGPLELAELMLRVLFASPDVVSGLPALQETWHPPLVRGSTGWRHGRWCSVSCSSAGRRSGRGSGVARSTAPMPAWSWSPSGS